MRCFRTHVKCCAGFRGSSQQGSPAKSPWLVMDMDGTITPTPSSAGGHYLPLSQSPCHEPLKRWLQLGGSICVVSTAGRRMWRQIHEVLKPELIQREGPRVGRLVISGFSGAVLFHSDPHTGDLVEDREYRQRVVQGGTCFDAQHADTIHGLLLQRARDFFRLAERDATIIPSLSRKYREPYQRLVESLRVMGEDKFFAEVLTDKAMGTPGAFLSATNNSIVSRMTVPGAPDAVAQLSLLGVPMARFNDVMTTSDASLVEQCGGVLRAQPNSVLASHGDVHKGLPIEWMVRHSECFGNFSVSNSLAFGDAPESVDRALLDIPRLPFVSCAPKNDPVVASRLALYVGDEEKGVAEFLSWFLDLHGKDIQQTGCIPELVTLERRWR